MFLLADNLLDPEAIKTRKTRS